MNQENKLSDDQYSEEEVYDEPYSEEESYEEEEETYEDQTEDAAEDITEEDEDDTEEPYKKKKKNNKKTTSGDAPKKAHMISLLVRGFLTWGLVCLAVYIAMVLTGSNAFLSDMAEKNAYVQFDADIDKTGELAQQHYNNLYAIAGRLEYAKSTKEVEEIMESYIGSDDYGDLRYYTQGKSFAANGLEMTDDEISSNGMIAELSQSKTHGCTDVYFDAMAEVDCIAFFVPVRGSVYVDGVLSIIPARHIINLDDVLRENVSATLLIDQTGKILTEARAESFTHTFGSNFYAFVSGFAINKEAEKNVEEAVRTNEKTVCSLEAENGSYLICVSPLSVFGGNALLVSMMESKGLIAPEMEYIRHAINISVIAIAVLLIGVVIAIIRYRKTKTALTSAKTIDHMAGCPNAEQFKKSAESRLAGLENQYAMMILEVRQFQYIQDRLDEKMLSDILRFIAKVIETFCDSKETYGYLGEGRFVLLLNYSGDRSIRERIRLIETVVTKNAILGTNKVRRKFNVGVSLVADGNQQSVKELIGHATLACEKARTDMNSPYVLHNEQINSEREHQDRIEAEMENALANNEFRLFLQPKYNVASDRIDSAEALVRWFDVTKGDYRFPGEFIGLFESNGFITKLDHFMYIEILKFLSSAAKRGDKLIPISVNVSMVTVSSPDFLEFYIENKKSYEVGDGFITIEFTESFAADDYQRVREIVDELHANGIRCSLDDFGTGYSSLGVFKNIPFDEIKFDRVFLSKSDDQKVDDAMLDTLVNLAKSMHMRVVQEGVETEEMFRQSVERGCDIIQGYYYAKAISAEECRLFIKSNTSIKYKSRVK